ncbi:MAG: CHAT domain-containing protein [Deltaproteobacteria bacterium]|nr:CHAT domain-containing protein [Deltaproteobacteria bacterium]
MKKNRTMILLLSALVLGSCGLGSSKVKIEPLRPMSPPFPGIMKPIRVTAFMSNELMAVISPDARFMYYVSDRAGNPDIWVRPVNGGRARQLTNHPVTDTQPAISPDGRLLAFTSSRDDAKGDIFVMQIDSRTLIKVSGSGTQDSSPSFVPTRNALVYNSRKQGAESWDIVYQSLSGEGIKGKPRVLCKGLSPSVSKDGRYMVYIGFEGHVGGGGDIFVMDLATGERRQLTRDLLIQAFPSWSADGRRIIFDTFFDDTNSDGRIDLDDNPSVWSLAFNGMSEPANDKRQLTSSRFPAMHPKEAFGWLFFTTNRGGQLDIMRCPSFGMVPPRASPLAQFRLARDIKAEPYDRQMALRATARWPGSREFLQADYDLASSYEKQGVRNKARQILADLMKRLPDGATLKGLSEIMLAKIKVEEISKGLPPSALNILEKAALHNRAQNLLDLVRNYPASGTVKANAMIEAARAFKRAGENSLAISVLKKLSSADFASQRVLSEAGLLMAGIFSMMGPTEGAVDSYVKLIRLFPAQKRTSEQAADKAIRLVQTGKTGLLSKIEAIRRLIDSNRDLPLLCAKAEMEIARILEKANKPEQAMQELKLLIDKYGKDRGITARARFAVARLAESAGRENDAISQLEILLQWWKDDPRVTQKAHKELTRIALEKAHAEKQEGELGMAVKTYRRLIKAEPWLLKAHRELIALLAARGEASRIVRYYKDMALSHPDDFVWQYCFGLSLTYLSPPALDKAQTELEKAISMNPSSPFPHQTLGWVLEQQEVLLKRTGKGLEEKALEEYDAALALTDLKADKKAASDLELNLANGFYRLMDYNKALKYCRLRLSQKMGFDLPAREAQFMLRCGHSATRQNEFADAEKYLSRSLELALKLGRKKLELEARKRLAFALRQAGEYEKAAGQFEKAANLILEHGKKNELVVMYRDIGECYYLAGKQEKALSFFEKARFALKKYGAVVKKESGFLTMVKQIGLSGENSSAARGFTAEEEENLYLTYVGALYRNAGDIKKAEKSYKKRLKWLEKRYQEDNKKIRLRTMAVVSSNLSYFRYVQDDMKGALDYQTRSLSYSQESGDLHAICLCAENIGHLVSIAGPTEKWSIKKAIALQESTIDSIKQDTAKQELAACRTILFLNLGELYFRLGTSPVTPHVPAVRLLAGLDSRRKALLESLKWLQKAKKAASGEKSRNSVRLQAVALADMAGSLYELGSNETAGRKLEEALGLSKRFMLDDLAWRIKASFSLMEQSETSARRALAMLEASPAWIAGDINGQGRKDADRLYDFLAEKAILASNWSGALEMVEKRDKRRVFAFFAGILQDQEKIHKKNNDPNLNKLKDLVRSWQSALTRMDGNVSTKQGSVFKSKARKARARLVSFLSKLCSNTRYAVMFGGSVHSVKSIQEALKRGDFLLRLAAIQGELYGILVSSNGIVRSSRLGTVRNIHELLKKHRREALTGLSHLLTGKFSNDLKKAKRLYIVPGDVTSLVPFSKVFQDGMKKSFGITITLLGTASYLVESRNRRSLNHSNILVLGPAGKDVSVLDRLLESKHGLDVSFPRARQSLDEILGGKAKSFSILHLQNRLILDSDLPAKSGILPCSKESGLKRFSLLDLASTDLSATLVVFADTKIEQGKVGVGTVLPALHAAVLAAGVPSFVLAGSHQSGIAPKFAEFYSALGVMPKAEAFTKVFFDKHESGTRPEIEFFGYMGLTGGEAGKLASSKLKTAIGSALRAFSAKRYGEAVSRFEEAIAYKTYLGDKTFLDKLLTGLSYSLEKTGREKKAAQVQERLVSFLEKNAGPKAVLNARSRLGGLLIKTKDYLKASRIFEENAGQAAKLNMNKVRVVALASAGDSLQKAGNYTKAAKLYTMAVEKLEPGKDKRLEFKLLSRLGTLYYLRTSDYLKASQYFEQGLALARGMQSKSMLFSAEIGLSRVYRRMGELDRAERDLDLCAKIAEATRENRMLADVALEKGNLAWYRGNYNKTLSALDHAMVLASGLRDRKRELFARNTKGVVLMSVGRLGLAMKELERALALARKLDESSEVSSTLNNMGRVMLEKGDLKKALSYFNMALDIDRERRDDWGKANDHRNIAMVFEREGKKQSATKHLRLGLELSARVKDSFNRAMCELALGRLTGDRAPAARHFENALSIADKFGMKEIKWRALYGLGKLDVSGSPGKAEQFLARAIGVVEGMRAALKVEELQSGFIGGKEELYDDMILLLTKTGRTKDAFSYAERARSRAFIDLLGNKRVRARNSADRALLAREQSIRSKIDRLEMETRKGEATNTEEARQKLDSLRQEYENIIIELKRTNPQLASFVSVEPSTSAEIQALLPRGTVLIEYHLTQNFLVVFALTMDSLYSKRIEVGREEIRKKVQAFRKDIQTFSDTDKDARRLYDILVKPVQAIISDARQLCIVPHGLLHYLPFAALKGPSGYIGAKYPVFYAPSASVLKYIDSGGQKEHMVARDNAGYTQLKVLAVGNPELGDASFDLPFAEKEVKAISFSFENTKILIRKKATKHLVEELAPKYDAIHLGCHGEFNPKSPLFSRLVLAPDDHDDGYLTVSEIFDLNLHARLVTLSACQTGLEAIRGGDELVGLNRAFIFAGARSIISSLWRVSDVATAVLVKRFYRYLSQGRTEAEALKEAQDIVRKYFPHPAYWAAFRLVGPSD